MVWGINTWSTPGGPDWSTMKCQHNSQTASRPTAITKKDVDWLKVQFKSFNYVVKSITHLQQQPPASKTDTKGSDKRCLI